MTLQAFLEERFPINVQMGGSWEDDFNVEITRTVSEKEYRRLIHPFPVRRFNVKFTERRADLYAQVMALYHRAYGRFAGFRVKALDDNSTNGTTGTPTATDQLLGVVTAGSVYQLRKEYGLGAVGLVDIGRPFRNIYKPVAGSVSVAIRNGSTGDKVQTAFAVDTTTGLVTFNADKTATITGISQAAAAVLSVGIGNPFNVGDSVHISGVLGMTEINGKRGTVTVRTVDSITVDINSSSFSTYTSGGVVHTRPQSGEEVRGGCSFDIPCRFDSSLTVRPLSKDFAETDEITLIELIAL